MEEACWLPTNEYFFPVSGPNCASDIGNLSQERRCAQLLGGFDVPTKILDALIEGAGLDASKDHIVLMNFTPFDACWELAALSMHNRSSPRFHCISTGLGLDTQSFIAARNRVNRELLDDWRKGNFLWMPRDSPPYQPNPRPEEMQKFDVSDPPTLQCLEWVESEAASAQGLQKVKCPHALRNKWLSDPVRSVDWRECINKFDHEMQENIATGDDTRPVTPRKTEPEADLGIDWVVGPKNTLLDGQAVHAQFPGPAIGTLFIVTAGEGDDPAKMYLTVSGSQPMTVGVTTPLMFCGVVEWVKPPKGLSLQQKPSETHILTFNVPNDQVTMALEMTHPDKKIPEDAEPATIYQLISEMEGEGIMDTKWWGYNCHRSAGAAHREEDDHYIVTPVGESNSEDNALAWSCKVKAVRTAALSINNIASYFESRPLLESPNIQLIWRVYFEPNAKQIIPKKPLWFLRTPITLKPEEAIRIV